MTTAGEVKKIMDSLRVTDQKLTSLITPHLIEWIELQITAGTMDPEQMKNQYYFVSLDDEVAVYENKLTYRWGTPVPITRIHFPLAFIDDPDRFYAEMVEQKRVAEEERKQAEELARQRKLNPTPRQIAAAEQEAELMRNFVYDGAQR